MSNLLELLIQMRCSIRCAADVDKSVCLPSFTSMYMTPYKVYNFKRKINKHFKYWRRNHLVESVVKVFNKMKCARDKCYKRVSIY